MKKIMLLILISSLLVLGFVSCEGDIFTSLSTYMGYAGENVLISQGVVVPSTENVEALQSTIATITDETTVEDVADDIRDSIAELLESDSETESAGEMLAATVETADIPTAVSTKMTELETDFGITIDIENEADLAAAILLTDLISKADAAITDEEKEAVAQEAKVVLEFVKKTSVIGSLDVTGAVGDLLSGMLDKSRAVRGTRKEPAASEEYDLAMIMDTAGAVFEMYFENADANSDGTLTQEEFDALKSDWGKMVVGYQNGAVAIQVSTTVEMKLSDILYYLSSIIITKNDALLPSGVGDPTMVELLNLIHGYITDGLTDIPTGEEEGAEDWAFLDSAYLEDMMNILYDEIIEPKLGEDTSVFEDTIIAISSSIPDNDYATQAIQDFIDGLKPAEPTV